MCLVLFVLKPSNCTLRTYNALKLKLKFLVKDFDVSADEFRAVCEGFFAKCDIIHSTWDGLSSEFATLMNAAEAEGKALATRVTHPNLTALKLIETVRVKIPKFPLTAFTVKVGENHLVQRMMQIANKYPYVMVASDCKDLAKEMNATLIPYTAYLCRQLCEKYLQTKSLAQLANTYNLGIMQAEIDHAVAQFTEHHPITSGRLDNLYEGDHSDDDLIGFTAFTPQGPDA